MSRCIACDTSVFLRTNCRISTVPCIALLKQQTYQVDCMVLFISILIFLIRHILLNVWFYLNFTTNRQVKFYSTCIFGGRKWTCTNALPNINYLVFCCEEKVAFSCYKREILWNPSLSDFCQKHAGCLPALYPSTWQVAQPSKSCSCLCVRAGSTCRAAGS